MEGLGLGDLRTVNGHQTTKHNWSAWCQYNVTGWVSMWVYGAVRQHRVPTNRHLISKLMRHTTKCEKHDLEAVSKEIFRLFPFFT